MERGLLRNGPKGALAAMCRSWARSCSSSSRTGGAKGCALGHGRRRPASGHNWGTHIRDHSAIACGYRPQTTEPRRVATQKRVSPQKRYAPAPICPANMSKTIISVAPIAIPLFSNVTPKALLEFRMKTSAFAHAINKGLETFAIRRRLIRETC